ncbi:hypothetical protein D1007_00977 [Hordeum vulgare]|nr:hypothetical protein D1007_00977 [Hordeum vulgare]
MRVSGSWKLSVGGVPMPQSPFGVDQRVEVMRIRSSLPESSLNLTRYAPDSNTLCTTYFERRHADQLAATNVVDMRGRFNFEGAAYGGASSAVC